MSKVLDLIDKLAPLPSPLELNRMQDHVAPFLHSHADSFERWVLLRNYELQRPPLSQHELNKLRKAWVRKA